ncbi:hypothetical protein AZI86_16960 [Bdellovibrio bacteriovorus]|uniref:Uncharacterized protein n=1 Tax=Bdellovibrio bacteriovorus TaxID=959 RepID=A0A150WEM1_BDEBC|nr:hypothetical protein [Bdellovibrio bacteriovorus]KYG61404.1 hypothetical protein AZI86_16960 [Bdellovibrio bacteriovorus]
MLKLLRFLQTISLILGWNFLAQAAEICPPQSNLEIHAQAQALAKTSCVAQCTKIYKEQSQEQIDKFEKNCDMLAKNGNPFTQAEGIKEAKEAVNEATLLCLPVATKNAVVGTYELIKALPSMVGFLVSGSWAKDVDSERMAGIEFCKGSVDCRRAMARNTILYQNKNPDGSWQISDEEVDKQISSRDFYDLHRQAVHDVPLAKNECLGYLASLRRKMSADGEDWTEERHKAVAAQMGQQHPHCPGILKFAEPPYKAPTKKEETLEQCLARQSSPLLCLAPQDMFATSYVCNGLLETCAALTEFFIPLPGPKVVKLIKLGKKSEIAAVAVKDGVEVAESKPVRALTGAQKFFVGAYKERVFVDEAGNRRFMGVAEHTPKTLTENKTRVLDNENSVMKILNDETNDKELVTSLTNYQKDTLIKRLDKLKEKYPDMDFSLYSDFKSVKLGVKSKKEIDAVTDKRLIADLNKVLAESNREFAAKMKELGIDVPKAGKAEEWFKSGYGRSADEAATAARKARQTAGSDAVAYSSAQVQEDLSKSLADVERKRQEIAGSKSFSSLMQRTKKGVNLPKEDVLDLVRKNKDPESLASAISKRYELSNFTAKEAAQLQDYVKGVDEFSPTILIAKRENVNLDEANLGGLSADFLGMGSANLRATAEGIAQKETVDAALIGAREGEKKVTNLFKARMEKFRKIVGDASCSGDDCAMAKVMTEKEKLEVMRKLARNPETRGVRMSFIGSNVSPEVRMKLASHGESIEKTFRKELEGKIPYSKLNKMTFGFDMRSTELNQGSVNLVLGKGRGTRLSTKEQNEMNAAFRRALEKHNQEKLATYSQGTQSYSASQIYWVPGVSVFGADEDEP